MSDNETPKDIREFLKVDRELINQYNSGNITFEKLSVMMMGTRNEIDALVYENMYSILRLVQDINQKLNEIVPSKGS